MKIAQLAVKVLLIFVPCLTFGQSVWPVASNEVSARSQRVHYLADQDGGGTISDLSEAFVRVDQTHVFKAEAATARVLKGPLGETTVTAESGIVVDETNPNLTAHLTKATVVWDPTKSTWNVGADRIVVGN
jgi:hypothetical protein